MRTLLVTGGSGLLGTATLRAARNAYDRVIGTHREHPILVDGVETVAIDLTDRTAVEGLIAGQRPDAVIHCAAATNVDWCQEHPGEARRINVEASGTLATSVAAEGGRLLYVSTDAVFDGERGDWTETDDPAPINVYAETKLEGEGAVLKASADAVVVRTNIFGWAPPGRMSLAEWVLERLEADREVPGFVDVRFSPLLVDELAHILFDLLQDGARGIYHAAARDGCSKYDFARMVAETFGHDPDRVRRTSVNEADLKAPRPGNTVLDVTRIEAFLGREMPTVRQGVERFRELRATAELGSAADGAGTGGGGSPSE